MPESENKLPSPAEVASSADSDELKDTQDEDRARLHSALTRAGKRPSPKFEFLRQVLLERTR